jgi:hypothetical protein
MTMGAQIPVITEKPLVVCGARKFHLDTMGDHLCFNWIRWGTISVPYSVVKKAHNWEVE